MEWFAALASLLRPRLRLSHHTSSMTLLSFHAAVATPPASPSELVILSIVRVVRSDSSPAGRGARRAEGDSVFITAALFVLRDRVPLRPSATSPYGGGNQESMWKWNKITSSEAQARRRGSTRVILFKRNLLQLSSAHRVARWAAGKAKRPVFRPSVSIQNRGEEAYAASFSSLSPEGPLSLPLAETSRSMNSITAIGAASPKR